MTSDTPHRQQPWTKYRPCPPVDLPDRLWPSRTITQAPLWCSVDLRDGNQALAQPMSVDEKLEFFRLLAGIGFRQIEVGFPAASQVEFDFTRRLIAEGLVPEQVSLQVLTQAREPLIRRSFEALRGARRAILHLYNSTSTLQRRVVFGMSRREVLELAVAAVRQAREGARQLAGTDVVLEYSPESFTGTEPEFALEICEAVLEAWGASAARPVILNLPATVEMSTPNVYADRIEWFLGRLSRPERAILSVHAHNDRGTAVAATELALLAGAARVEGTLFGNGERTGNVDLLTLALNLLTQGVDPGLDFSAVDRVAAVYERCTRQSVHPRHPYAGELVHTAFSGSHQDAISKGLRARERERRESWEVPYLPIDPADIGRTYEAVIRINSQSGKGGAAWVLEREHGYTLPKAMHPEFGALVQRLSETGGGELAPAAIRAAFEREYLGRPHPLELVRWRIEDEPAGDAGDAAHARVRATVADAGVPRELSGAGNGPIDAFCAGLRGAGIAEFALRSYHEHALGQGSGARAVAYIQIETAGGARLFGVGVDTDIAAASFRAILGALNRLAENA
ncbi:MAG: 2-isopropylmalate synthase [Candidatus Geothermincolia bacterium]